ncbi:hypothetical protein LC092_09005 [Stappia stellulata]|uniref:hypothetical protein n=1 Tax=Stappia stellulata TaxID=71235 RepID=UPI001CD6307B|nr:hypothetical protein [Stappia stellulata]MCA1242574.1 hypothetical protein [Stappia stellulata]
MDIFRLSARRAVIFALLLLASVHIDASAARALSLASHPVSLDPAAAALPAGAGATSSVAQLDAADERSGAFTSKTCPRAGACVGYILPFAPPLAVPAPVRGRHLQVVWQEPAPVAMGRLTPPPR